MLADRQEKKRTLVCVGLDPLSEKLPESVLGCNIATKIKELEKSDPTAAIEAYFAAQSRLEELNKQKTELEEQEKEMTLLF